MSHVNQSNVAVRQCSLRRREYSRLPQHSTLPILNMILVTNRCTYISN